MRLPRVVQLRMLLERRDRSASAGAIPFVGDAADFFWKSNTKNFALLEQHAYEVRPATAGDWLFVSAILLAILAVALVAARRGVPGRRSAVWSQFELSRH